MQLTRPGKVLARWNPIRRRIAVDLARGEEQETLDAGLRGMAEQAAQADHVGIDGLDRKAAVEGGRGNGRRMDDVVETLRERHGGDVSAHDLDVAARRERGEPGGTPALERVASGDAQRTPCPRIGYARENMQQLRAEKARGAGEENALAGKALGKCVEARDRLVGIAAQMGVHWRKPSGGHPTRRRLYGRFPGTKAVRQGISGPDRKEACSCGQAKVGWEIT